MEQRLILEPEYAVYKSSSCCGEQEQRTPYGEISNIGKVSGCSCCGTVYSVQTNMFMINPGCGCDEQLVDEIVGELKARTQGRGDAGQVQRQEHQMVMLSNVDQKINSLEVKMNLILKALNVRGPNGETVERI